MKGKNLSQWLWWGTETSCPSARLFFMPPYWRLARQSWIRPWVTWCNCGVPVHCWAVGVDGLQRWLTTLKDSVILKCEHISFLVYGCSKQTRVSVVTWVFFFSFLSSKFMQPVSLRKNSITHLHIKLLKICSDTIAVCCGVGSSVI